MLSARNFGLILALCVIIRVLPDLTFEYKDTICPYSHVERRFKASDAFFLEKHVVNAPFIRRSRASRYFAGRVQYSTNGASTVQIQRDLLVCGDISSTLALRKAKVSPSFHAASVVSQRERTKTPFCARLVILGPTQNVSN